MSATPAMISALRGLREQGMSGSEAGRELGITQQHAARLARENGFPFPRRFNPAPRVQHRHPENVALYAQMRSAACALDTDTLASLTRIASRLWGAHAANQEADTPSLYATTAPC